MRFMRGNETVGAHVVTSVASAIGLLLPWWLARLAIDPAYGSGPVATVIQDVISLLVYFGVALAVGL